MAVHPATGTREVRHGGSVRNATTLAPDARGSLGAHRRLALDRGRPALGIHLYFAGNPSPRPGRSGVFGSPSFTVGSGNAVTAYVASGEEYFPTEFALQSSSSGVEADRLAFRLENSTGVPLPFAFIGVVNASGCWIDYLGGYSGEWQTGTPSISPPDSIPCSPSPGLASVLNSGDEFVLVTVHSVSGQGDVLSMGLTGNPDGSASVPIA